MRKLDERELSRTWSRYLADRQERDRNALVEHYLPYVDDTLRRTRLRTEYDREYIRSGMVIALIRAVERYEPDRGMATMSWILSQLRGVLSDQQRTHGYMTRAVWDTYAQKCEMWGRLTVEKGRPPSEDELVEALGITPDKYAEMQTKRKFACGPEPLEALVEPDDDEEWLKGNYHPALVVDGPDPNWQITEAVLQWCRQHRDSRTAQLRRQIIYNHLFCDETLKSQAIRIERSESRVHQIYHEALRELRQHLEERGFTP